jgi:hypothetical protein
LRRTRSCSFGAGSRRHGRPCGCRLRDRGVIRSGNAPAGDYAELLVQRATAGELAPDSQRSWDVLTPEGERLQVKARVVTSPTRIGERQHGLRFEPSHEHAGLQLVDVVAYVTRRAILEPDNDVIHRAYAHLRDNLRTERDGQALRLVSGGGGREQEIDDYRYRLVL